MISQLNLQQFRNLTTHELKLHPGFNIITGPNGAGKTSILEALYFLSMGRSFRSKQLNRIIQTNKDNFIIFAQSAEDKIGLLRDLSGQPQLKMNGNLLKRHSEITRRLPILLFNPESLQLLTEGSKPRRQLIDWGLFYSVNDFLIAWQQYKHALRQRNTALRAKLPKEEITLWDDILVQIAQKIDPWRDSYSQQLAKALTGILNEFLTDHNIKLQYYRGWNKEHELATLLQDNLMQDIKNAFTSAGPHRADLRITVGGKPAHELLSRGQQKLLIASLKLAQGLVLKDTNQECIYLLDDINSELDQKNQQKLIGYLRQLNSQVLLTSINENITKYFTKDEFTLHTLC